MSVPKIHFLIFYFLLQYNIILRVFCFERQITKKKRDFSSADLVDYYIMLLCGSRQTFDTRRRPVENRFLYTYRFPTYAEPLFYYYYYY